MRKYEMHLLQGFFAVSIVLHFQNLKQVSKENLLVTGSL